MRTCIVTVVVDEILRADVITERLHEVVLPLDVQLDVVKRLNPAGKYIKNFLSTRTG